MYQSLKELPKALKIIFPICLFTVLILDLWLFNLPPLFPKAFEVGTLIHKLSSAMLSAIIIFYFAQQYPKIAKRRERSIFLNNSLMRQRLLARDLLITLWRANDQQFEDNGPPDLEIILSFARVTEPRSRVIFFGNSVEYDSWLLLLDYIRIKTNEMCLLFLTQSDILPSQLLRDITRLYNDINLSFNPEVAQTNMGNLNLEFAMRNLYNFLVLSYSMPRTYSHHF